jgi:hypothetical protein
MIGGWDATGILAAVAVLVVGVAIGAWGIGRRDIGR